MNVIIIFWVFIKRSLKTPAKEIELAKKWLAGFLMKQISHNELMQNDEYRAAWQAEKHKERLRVLLAKWRKHGNLTKAQVAERMGVTSHVISRLENNITKASVDILTRYAQACGIKKPTIPLY